MAVKNMTPLLQVYDVKASVAFYCDMLGFELARSYEPDGHFYWASLELGGAKLMLNARYEDDKRPAEPEGDRINAHGDTELYFECDNVVEIYTSLKKKGVDLRPPAESNYGAMEIKLRDPDGFGISFFQPME